MPRRKEFLANGGIYHILNRFIHNTPYFQDNDLCLRFFDLIKYYLQVNPPIKYSLYKRHKKYFPLDGSDQLVSVINYCLMPTHFHFTLRQETDNGIEKYIQRISNSFSHYVNLINETRGPIFEGTFKAVKIESNEQLLHLSRYIHLNPVSSDLVKKPEDYGESSYRKYIRVEERDVIDSSLVLDQFLSPDKYAEFVNDNIEYQRELEKIKHLSLE